MCKCTAGARLQQEYEEGAAAGGDEEGEDEEEDDDEDDDVEGDVQEYEEDDEDEEEDDEVSVSHPLSNGLQLTSCTPHLGEAGNTVFLVTLTDTARPGCRHQWGMNTYPWEW